MSTTPVITIFVRHSSDCKYRDDETWKRCRCRKHLRWSHNGKQYRQSAGTRSWEGAENKRQEILDRLAGRPPKTAPEQQGRMLQDAIDTFNKEKKVEGVSKGVLAKYTRELDRFRSFAERAGVWTVQGITREMLTEFCLTWEDAYPSTYTRSKVRERLRSFLRYCYEAQWLPRIPSLPKVQVDEPPTMPLSEAEYKKLLDSIYGVIPDADQCKRVHALFQLQRHSGLAIRDALTLERNEIVWDAKKKLHRIVTKRQKTGVHISVPIPPDVAKELLEVLNGNPRFVFWSGEGEQESITKNWSKYYIAPVFKAAGLDNGSWMKSHRLRDTFAVDLLQKGVPLEEVSKLLGHESIKTTEKSYAKWVKGRQDRLDSLVTDTWKR